VGEREGELGADFIFIVLRGGDVLTKDSTTLHSHTFFASGLEIPNVEVLETLLAILTNDNRQTPRDIAIALTY
jgi:hypothetical protein